MQKISFRDPGEDPIILNSNDLVENAKDITTSGSWGYYIYRYPKAFNSEIIDMFANKFDMDAWAKLITYRPDLLTKEVVSNNLAKMGLLSSADLAKHLPQLFDRESFLNAARLLTNYGRYSKSDDFFVNMAKNRPEFFTDQVLEKYNNYLGPSTYGFLTLHDPNILKEMPQRLAWPDFLVIAAKRPELLTENIVFQYGDVFNLKVWFELFKNNPELFKKYIKYVSADDLVYLSDELPEIFTTDILLDNEKALEQFGPGSFNKAMFGNLAIRNTKIFTDELLQKYGKYFAKTTFKTLLDRDFISKEDYLKYSSSPPEHLKENNSATVAVSEHDYILLRKVEKFMEENNLAALTSKVFERLNIKENPIIKQLLKENSGKPIKLEQIENKLERTEYYQHWGTYDSSTQSHPEVKNLPRHTFTLGLKNIEGLSENTKSFLEEEMLTHGIGFGDSDEFGFILYKILQPKNTVDKKRSVLIEEIQSDMARMIPKIFAQYKSENQRTIEEADKRIKSLQEEYGGEAGLKQISTEINQLTKNYVRVLLNSFLKNFRGWTVYISNAENAVALTNLNDAVANKIYNEIPKQYGFKENEEIPWALKLERASIISKRDKIC